MTAVMWLFVVLATFALALPGYGIAVGGDPGVVVTCSGPVVVLCALAVIAWRSRRDAVVDEARLALDEANAREDAICGHTPGMADG